MRRLRDLLLATVLLPGVVIAQDVPLSGEQIRAAWVGKKVFGRAGSNLLEFRLHPDGTGDLAVGNSFQDTGTWRIVEGGYCATWKKVRNGQERCFTVVQRGGTTLVLNPDQSVNAEVIRVID